MPVDRAERTRKKRLRHATRKLRDARRRLARAERSVAYWTRKLNDLKYESVRAIQLPLISDAQGTTSIPCPAPLIPSMGCSVHNAT
jgi:hypothetical protein